MRMQGVGCRVGVGCFLVVVGRFFAGGCVGYGYLVVVVVGYLGYLVVSTGMQLDE